MFGLIGFLFFIGTLVSGVSLAKETYRDAPFEDIRWLGRGNTGVAVIRDQSALFYNPAGLGRSGHYSVNLMKSAAGITKSAVDNAQAVGDIRGAGTELSDKMAPFLGEPVGLRSQFFPALSVPYFGLGVFYLNDVTLEYRNPVSPELTTDVVNDFGVIGGLGLPVFPNLYIGASVRWFKRRTINQDFSGATILDISSSTIKSFMKRGSGYGFNVGFQYDLPLGEYQALSLGFAVEDLGNTRIRTTRTTGPLDQNQSMNLGMAYTFDSDYLGFKFLVDARNLGEGDYYPTGKILYQGVELNLLKMDVRAGFYHGYWTAGLSIRWLPGMNFDLTTYAEEIDSQMGFRENRFYMLGFTVGLDRAHAGKKQQKYTLDHL